MKKNKIKKYIIYSPRRTGSTLYGQVLSTYYQELQKETNFSEKIISWQDNSQSTCFDNYNDFLIYHTHDIDFFSQAPEEFVKILSVRSILDSVLSLLVAFRTKMWHPTDENSKEEYLKNFQNEKFYLHPTDLKSYVIEYDWLFCRAHRVIESSKHSIILSYQAHAMDLKNLYQCLNITNPYLSKLRKNNTIANGGTRFLNKFSLISNLNELANVYEHLKVINNYDDHITLQNIRKYIKK